MSDKLQAERERFEAWATAEGYPMALDVYGNWLWEPTKSAWKAWQAALSSSQQVRDDALDEAARIADNAEWEDGFRIDNPLPAQIAFSIRKLRSDFNKVTGVFSSMEIGTDPIIPSVAPAFPSQPSSVAMMDDLREKALNALEWFYHRAKPTYGKMAFAEEVIALLQSSPKGASTGMDRVNFRGINPLNPTATAVLPMVPDSWRYKFTKNDDGSLSFDYNDYGDFVAWKAVEPFLSSPREASKPQDVEERRISQLAGISTAAMGYWKEGDSIHPDYDSVALRDVAKLYAKYVAASQPSAASGRELPPLPNTAYWWSPKTSSGMTQGLACWSTNSGPHPAWDITDYYTADQMREYALAALSAAPADANADWKNKRKVIEDAIIGLRDGWAIRSQAEEALEVLATIFPTAPEPSAPADKVDEVDRSCQDENGCPTEGAVLKRCWHRYQWLANRVLYSDYGDNQQTGQQIGWGIRSDLRHGKPFMFGSSIDAAIDRMRSVQGDGERP